MTSCFKSKANANVILFVEDTVNVIVCICRNSTSNCQGKVHAEMSIVCLFPQDTKNIDHVCQDMTKDEFKDVCKHARLIPHNFVVINLPSQKTTLNTEAVLIISC